MSEPLLAALVDRSIDAGDEHSALRGSLEVSFHDFAACAHAGLPHVPRLELSDAGRLALAAHVLDRDDVHWGAVAHPGGIVWPTALAVAADYGSSSAELKRAVVAGYELLVRLATAFGSSHRRHWQPTSTAGPAAAALVTALLAGANAETARDAVAHALSLAGGSSVALAEGVKTSWFHRLHAVDTGIAAAQFAAAGCTGTQFALEGPAGLLRAFGDDSNPEPLTRKNTAAIVDTSVRIAAVSGWALAAVSAAAALGPIAADEIEVVEILAHPGAAAPAVRGAVIGAVARAVVDGVEPLLPATAPRSDVARVVAVTALAEGRADGSACVSVTGAGQRRSADAWPPGHPKQPDAPERVEAKWRALWGPGWAEARTAIAGAWQRERPSGALIAVLESGTITGGGAA